MTVSPPRLLTVAQISAPCLCMDVEISNEIPSIPAQSRPFGARCAWLLVWVHTEPIGSIILDVPHGGLTSAQVAAGIWIEFGEEIVARTERISQGVESPFVSSRHDLLLRAPHMTIVVCTRERPEKLRACLRSLLVQDYPEFRVLVVDNFPSTDRSKAVVEGLASPLIEYVVEPRKGLSRARNTAVSMVGDGVVAFIDDDEIASGNWLAELARGFQDHPEADAVTGAMVPAELETPAQVLFEQYCGFTKLRGFKSSTFSPATANIQSPLYPLPPFGSGGNMALQTKSLRRIGGFDVALGPGTPSMASEDTRILTDLLRTGGTVVYQPTAVTRHFHRRSIDELRVQMEAYGVGLTAFYMSLVISCPDILPDLVRLVPRIIQDIFSKESMRNTDLPADFPSDLRKAKRNGALTGPMAYLRARVGSENALKGSVGSG